MQDRIRQRLLEQQEQGRYRTRPLLTRPQAALSAIRQQDIINFSANDYLGLANHPKLIQALQNGAAQWGVGGGAAHLVSGHLQPHEDLEQAIAQMTRRPRALLFSTGYMANLAVISSLLEKSDTVVHDRLNHASLLDGGLLAGCHFLRYQHVDMQNLQLRLARTKGRTLIVSDGVFSMDGDIAPINDLVQISRRHQAMLMIDDAHGIGVLGQNGGGCLEESGVDHHGVPILMGTLGKALGTAGAFIAGSEELIEYLIQFARPYIYTTAQSPAVACATLAAIELLEKEAWRRQHLQQLIHYFQSSAQQLNLPVLPSRTPIQPVIVGDNQKTMRLARQLRDQGFLVGAIRPPTVPEGSARLRIALSADHQPEHIDALLRTIAHLWNAAP